MKRFTFKGVLENFRTTISQQHKTQNEVEESLRKENFDFSYTIRHGFPHGATALAYDPLQNILAIGTETGFIRIFGKSGIDVGVRHVSEAGVQQIIFIVNEGLLVSSCSDDTLHLWNIKVKPPTIVHSLKFQRERITFSHLPFQSKWLYVGTERGNIHVVNVDTFKLSGYIINWNKTIALISKAHPGPIVHISDNPIDANKLLMGFESGTIVLWDLKNKVVDGRYGHNVTLRSVSWHFEGKSFISSHSDGSLLTWAVKQGIPNNRPLSIIYPHARVSRPNEKIEQCSSIDKVDWKSTKTGENLIIFSGGLACTEKDKPAVPTLTVLQGKSTTVLEMEHPIIDFVSVTRSPYLSEPCEPSSLIVLYRSDLLLVDLTTQGYPCFENPFALDVHESPVTVVKYFADCPAEIIPLLYSVGMRQKKTGYSDKNWPLTGGECGKFSSSYPEIILTGHADGTVKFWDASAMNLQILYRLKTAKLFERSTSSSSSKGAKKGLSPAKVENVSCVPDAGGYLEKRSGTPADRANYDTSPADFGSSIAISGLTFEPTTRYLAVTVGAEQSDYTLLYSFNKCENRVPQIPMLALMVQSLDEEEQEGTVHTNNSNTICMVGSMESAGGGPGGGQSPVPPPRSRDSSKTTPTHCTDQYPEGTCLPHNTRLKVKRGALKQLPGFQIELIVFLSQPVSSPSPVNVTAPNDGSMSVYSNPEDPQERYRVKILAVKLQPLYGLIAIGTTNGLCIIDFVHKNILINLGTPDFYGSSDPFARFSKLFPGKRPPSTDPDIDKVKSPSIERACCCGFASPTTPTESVNQGSGTLNFAHSQQHSVVINNLQSPPGPESSTVGSPTSSGLGVPQEAVITLAFYHQSLATAAARGGSGNAPKNSPQPPTSGAPGTSSSTSPNSNFAQPESEHCGPLSPLWLWMGTSYGSTLVLSFSAFTSQNMAPANTKNSNGGPMGAQQPVIVSPTGSIFRLKGSMLNISFFVNPVAPPTVSSPSQATTILSGQSRKSTLAYNTANSSESAASTPSVVLLPTSGPQSTEGDNYPQNVPSPPTVAPGPHASENYVQGSAATSSSSTHMTAPGSAATAANREFAILVSECQACAVALPSMCVTYKVKTAIEGRRIMVANVCKFYNQDCLTCYASDGHIIVYSVPSFRLLFDVFLISPIDMRFSTDDHQEIMDVRRTICLSSNGNGLYLCSPSEIQKFTCSSEMCKNLLDMTSRLFRVRETPEPPKPSFFTGLFNTGKSLALDREELFGEASGKYSRVQTTHIPGPSSLALQETAQTASSITAGPVHKARQALTERGEKLGDLDERMAQMSAHAENYSKSAHDIMLKYKEKKWYQF